MKKYILVFLIVSVNSFGQKDNNPNKYLLDDSSIYYQNRKIEYYKNELDNFDDWVVKNYKNWTLIPNIKANGKIYTTDNIQDYVFIKLNELIERKERTKKIEFKPITPIEKEIEKYRNEKWGYYSEKGQALKLKIEKITKPSEKFRATIYFLKTTAENNEITQNDVEIKTQNLVELLFENNNKMTPKEAIELADETIKLAPIFDFGECIITLIAGKLGEHYALKLGLKEKAAYYNVAIAKSFKSLFFLNDFYDKKSSEYSDKAQLIFEEVGNTEMTIIQKINSTTRLLYSIHKKPIEEQILLNYKVFNLALEVQNYLSNNKDKNHQVKSSFFYLLGGYFHLKSQSDLIYKSIAETFYNYAILDALNEYEKIDGLILRNAILGISILNSNIGNKKLTEKYQNYNISICKSRNEQYLAKEYKIFAAGNYSRLNENDSAVKIFKEALKNLDTQNFSEREQLEILCIASKNAWYIKANEEMSQKKIDSLKTLQADIVSSDFHIDYLKKLIEMEAILSREFKIEEMNEKIDSLNKFITNLEAQKNKLLLENKNLASSNENLKIKIELLNKEIEEKKKLVESYSDSVVIYKNEKQNLENELKMKRSENEKLNNDIKNKKAEIGRLGEVITQSKVIYGLIILGLFIVFAFVFWLKKKQDKIKEQALEAKAKQASLNPHFIKRCLRTLNDDFQSLPKDKQGQIHLELANMVKEAYDYNDKQIIGIKEEIKLCKHLVDYYNLTDFKNSIVEFNYPVLKEIYSSYFIPPLLLFNMVDNCLKAAFIDVEYDKKIDIEFNYKENGLNIIVKDNGCGFDFENVKNDKEKNGGHAKLYHIIKWFNTKKYQHLIEQPRVFSEKNSFKGTTIIFEINNRYA